MRPTVNESPKGLSDKQANLKKLDLRCAVRAVPCCAVPFDSGWAGIAARGPRQQHSPGTESVLCLPTCLPTHPPACLPASRVRPPAGVLLQRL